MIFLVRNFCLGFFIITILFACSDGGGGSSNGGGNTNTCPGGGAGANINVSWIASKAAAVNKVGGGYKIYLSKTSGFNPGDSGVTSKNVAYVSGTSTASSTIINTTSSGKWYIRVAAFSSLNSGNGSGGSESIAADQVSICVS